ncbi:hypothetical protein DERP_003449 [Dermatophagoides pteronyssinus]|uniref:Uncharacterized protein n=1 Tax=Dermatophagoides pteronyssinus TaxID=6956 RepID=A0ABQ8JJK2_DERPT|nr:hypothetical protein DERP_003449 [Dermatophagoides pteronyssinus]
MQQQQEEQESQQQTNEDIANAAKIDCLMIELILFQLSIINNLME